jgi:hypothetical protein
LRPGKFSAVAGSQSEATKAPIRPQFRSAERKTFVRLSCRHLEEIVGDSSTLVGKRVLGRTCGAQTVESGVD